MVTSSYGFGISVGVLRRPTMPTVWSRPARPLGFHSNSDCGRRVVLWPPFESMAPERCPICLDDVRRGEFLEMKGCAHVACTACLLRYAASQWTAARTPLCPLCRSAESAGVAEFNVSAERRPLGLTADGAYRMFFLEDCYANWHCYATVHLTTGARFVTRGLASAAPYRRMRTFSPSSLCWIAPYHGWIVTNGAPDSNDDFRRVVERAAPVVHHPRESVPAPPRPPSPRVLRA